MFEWLHNNALWLIPAAPLLASLWIVVVGQFCHRHNAHRPVILALAVSFLATLVLVFGIVPQTFAHHAEGEDEHAAHAAADHDHDEQAKESHEKLVRPEVLTSTPTTRQIYQWMKVGGIDVKIGLQADAMTALMLLMVTSVSLLVAIFAAGYMQGDPGYPRFFAEIALFVFSMSMLVLADNFLLMFVFWEAVGLCSYLLIGFWFRKPSAAAAAKKAFVVNRIGDFGFLIGIFLIWSTFGTLEFSQILFDPRLIQETVASQPEVFLPICMLLFIGAVGKSAQFPLHVWLPDAMEGPTPVSALIHAATMVTAGVYLVARCTPLFVHAPLAQMTVAGIGAATALIAAITALTQYDLKRVLAYSTVSQLGYMFMALGAAGADAALATHAVTFAMFHMFTHAFFKAVLFLSAGSVMHAMGDVIDMREFSGLRKTLPKTHLAYLCGSLALAGFPLFSGFWSKDEILAILHQASQTGEHKTFYLIVLAVSLLTALLTAFYTFRAYFLTFSGPERFPAACHHPHESPSIMTVPLYLLAAGAVGIGFLAGPATHWYGHYLENSPSLSHAEAHAANITMMVLSTVLALVGIFVAWSMYGKTERAPYTADTLHGPAYNFSLKALYFDELYLAFVVRPIRALAELSELIDRLVIDKLVDAVGFIPIVLGSILRPIQGGFVQSYALIMLVGLAFCLVGVLRALAAM